MYSYPILLPLLAAEAPEKWEDTDKKGHLLQRAVYILCFLPLENFLYTVEPR